MRSMHCDRDQFETKRDNQEVYEMTQNNKTGNKFFGDSKGNQPETKFKAGAISATVWTNESVNAKGEVASYSTITIQRSYKDRNNEWKQTNSLRVTDLPKAALVLNKAYESLVMKQNEAEI